MAATSSPARAAEAALPPINPEYRIPGNLKNSSQKTHAIAATIFFILIVACIAGGTFLTNEDIKLGLFIGSNVASIGLLATTIRGIYDSKKTLPITDKFNAFVDQFKEANKANDFVQVGRIATSMTQEIEAISARLTSTIKVTKDNVATLIQSYQTAYRENQATGYSLPTLKLYHCTYHEWTDCENLGSSIEKLLSLVKGGVPSILDSITHTLERSAQPSIIAEEVGHDILKMDLLIASIKIQEAQVLRLQKVLDATFIRTRLARQANASIPS